MWDASHFSVFLYEGDERSKETSVFSISFQNHFTKSLLKTGRLHQYGTSMFSVCHLETAPLVVPHVFGFCGKEDQ